MLRSSGREEGEEEWPSMRSIRGKEEVVRVEEKLMLGDREEGEENGRVCDGS